MGFTKGNTLGQHNKGKLGKRKVMFNEVSDQLIALSPDYNDALLLLRDGQELPEPTIDFMNRFERMFEFARPKLARQIVSGDKDNPIQHKVDIQFIDPK